MRPGRRRQIQERDEDAGRRARRLLLLGVVAGASGFVALVAALGTQQGTRPWPLNFGWPVLFAIAFVAELGRRRAVRRKGPGRAAETARP